MNQRTVRAQVVDGVVNFVLEDGDSVACLPLTPDVARVLACELFDAANRVDPAGFERNAAAFAKQFANALKTEIETEALKNAKTGTPH